MNENEFDRTARAWLEDGPTRMSDRAVLSALEEIHTTRQRRAWWPARRATPVNIFVRAAIAAVLVIGVGLLAFNVLPREPDGSSVGGQPSASPSPSASAPPSPAQSAQSVVIPELTQTFVSSTNGFSIGYPDGATTEPATVVSKPGVDQNNEEFDFINNEPLNTFRGASTPIPDGDSVDDWVDRNVGGGLEPGGCGVPRSEQLGITIDGQPGRIWEGCPNEIEATVAVGQRVYVFSLFAGGLAAGDPDASTVSRAIFDAYASTIDLRPEEAASPAP
jgi:hypothetical protein